MNEEEHLKLKRRIGQIASGMIDGNINYLAGALELLSLRDEVGAYANDPDFLAFVAVAAEINNLPGELSRIPWSKSALKKHETEIQQSIAWAKEFSLENCKSLAKRFGYNQ